MTAAAAPRALGQPLAVRLLGNETAKGLLLLWRRHWVLAGSIAENAVTYLAIRFLIGGGRISYAMVAATLPALAAVFVASVAASQGSGGISEEVYGGTFEQTQLTPARPTILALGRLSALAVEGCIGASVLALGFGFGFGIHYSIHAGVLVPVLLTILDALGYAFVITALTLAVSSIGAVTHVFNMAIMLFNGTLVPILIYPGGIQAVLKLFPTTLGVQALNSTLSGRPLSAIWADGSLPWLLAHATALFAIGSFTYLYTMRRARKEAGFVPR